MGLLGRTRRILHRDRLGRPAASGWCRWLRERVSRRRAECDIRIDDLLARGIDLEVEHLADHAHERFGSDAWHPPQLNAVLNGIAEGEERDRREVGAANRGVEALGVLN